MSSHPSLPGPLWEPFEEGEQTSRFNGRELSELVLQSIEASTMFRARPDAPAVEAVVSPPPPAPAAGATPGFLAKPAAVLVLPEALAPPRPRLVPSPSRSAVALPAPRRRCAVAAAPVTWGAFVRRRLFALALLGVVVGSQPWWWNVGNLRARPPAPAPAAQR